MKRAEHRSEGSYDPLWHCAWLSSLSEPNYCHRPQRMASTGSTMVHEIWRPTESNWSGPLHAVHSYQASLALILGLKYLHPASFPHSMPGESASSLCGHGMSIHCLQPPIHSSPFESYPTALSEWLLGTSSPCRENGCIILPTWRFITKRCLISCIQLVFF